MHTKLIEQIRAGSFAEKELINLYNNAKQRQIAEVMEAAEAQMRARFSRTANKMFGKVTAPKAAASGTEATPPVGAKR